VFGTPVIVTMISGDIIEDALPRWSLIMRTIDFWYEFASTYSYVTAMRITQAAAKAGVAVRWRPFLLGPIFKELGWNDSPFNIYAAKGE
jgi:2-hydroxychromene-2-carboxylate isomerase